MLRSLATALLLLATTWMVAQEATVAMLPLSNVSGSPEAAAVVEKAIAARLAERGWKVAPSEQLEKLLEQERVRYLDSLPQSVSERVRTELGARAILLGSVLAYREGANPMVALAARMIDETGRVVWGDVVAISATETEGALGIGRRSSIESLAQEASGKLLRRVPRPGRGDGPALNAGHFATGPVTYRSGAHPRGEVRRICILPFVSVAPDASRIAHEILTVRLESKGDFDVVEPADFRAAMRAAGLRSVAAMTSSDLASLGRHLGTTIFLRGNLHTWRELAGGRSEIQMDMTLADVASGEILWAVTHQRRGADYAGAFQRGTVENIVALADRAISEAIAEQHRARPRGPKAAAREARQER